MIDHKPIVNTVPPMNNVQTISKSIKSKAKDAKRVGGVILVEMALN